MLGAEIPDGYLFGVGPVIVASIFGLMAWIVRELMRVSANLKATSRELDDLATRVGRLERPYFEGRA